MRTALSAVVFTALTTVSAIASAQTGAGAPMPPPPVLNATAVIGTPGFGDGYRVNSARRTAPNTVMVTVSFGGGCAQHDFVASYRTDATGVRISLHHDAHHDMCEAILSRRFVIALPAGMSATTPIRIDSQEGAVDAR